MTNDSDAPIEQAPAQPRPRRRLGLRIALWSVLGLVVLLGLAASMVYTERSSFCFTCHEMQPYFTAWQAGGHAGHAECVDCHVDPGVIAHLAHKPIALKEVWNHFFTDNRFPNYGVEVPNSRCVRCHKSVKTRSSSTFSHAKHEKQGTCQACHAASGHSVTLASLEAAGVLKAAATTPTVPGGFKPSRIKDHKDVVCQECHDQANMKCSQCHEAPHEIKGECSTCHAPGSAFAFVHGGAGADCAECHTPPEKHYGASCSSCHSVDVPLKDTKFTHPARLGEHSYRSFACVKCHPKNYTSSSCTCHGGKAPQDD